MKFGKSTEVPGAKCPACKAPLTGAAAVNTNAEPKKGDVSICIECGELLLYGEGLSVERLPFSVEMELKPDQLKNLYELRRIAKHRQLQMQAQLDAMEKMSNPFTVVTGLQHGKLTSMLQKIDGYRIVKMFCASCHTHEGQEGWIGPPAGEVWRVDAANPPRCPKCHGVRVSLQVIPK